MLMSCIKMHSHTWRVVWAAEGCVYVPAVLLLLLAVRYDVLQEMLEVLRDHQNNEHMSKLEWIVIVLIALAVRQTQALLLLA
jgi:hypothetical protein